MLEQNEAIRDQLRSLSGSLSRRSDLAKKTLIENDPETIKQNFWPWFLFVEVARMRLLIEKVAACLDLLQCKFADESSVRRCLLVGFLPRFRMKCAIRTAKVTKWSAHWRTELYKWFRNIVILLDGALLTGIVQVTAGSYIEAAAYNKMPVHAKAHGVAVLATAQFHHIWAASL